MCDCLLPSSLPMMSPTYLHLWCHSPTCRLLLRWCLPTVHGRDGAPIHRPLSPMTGDGHRHHWQPSTTYIRAPSSLSALIYRLAAPPYHANRTSTGSATRFSVVAACLFTSSCYSRPALSPIPTTVSFGPRQSHARHMAWPDVWYIYHF
jgi:hypothetical protein